MQAAWPREQAHPKKTASKPKLIHHDSFQFFRCVGNEQLSFVENQNMPSPESPKQQVMYDDTWLAPGSLP